MKTSSRPTRCATLVLAALALLISGAQLAGVAQARSRPAASRPPSAASQPATCLIHSLPSFVAQGEFAVAATVADVVEVECNPYVYGTGAAVTITAAQLFSRCGHEVSWYVPNEPGGNQGEQRPADAGFVSSSGPSVTLHLDVDGNANVALIAGPHCMVGESLLTLDQDESPYETFTTSFQVLPAGPTPQGLYATPSSQVEDAASSAVATIVQVEFNGASEAKVRLAAGQLYDRCHSGPHLVWVRENREQVVGPELVEAHAVELDNDGNGFALAIGSDSCAQGVSLIEGDLEQSPFTTLTTEFTVLPPQPTEEPAFTIVKSQEIKGSGSGFTTAPLTAAVGRTVDYQITVTNTSHVPETFTAFTDPHCDAGTIAGGPGSSVLESGQSTTYTCDHVLTGPGSYVNEATVTGNTVGGKPLTQTSNQVVVTVFAALPAFTIEKLQRIAGSGGAFTTTQLTGRVGQTVEYEIIVSNTGNVPLTLSAFTDPNCDSGTLAGGPGGAPLAPGTSTTYTCSHVLASTGSLVNVATVTGTPPEESPIKHESDPVEVKVTAPEPSFTIEKLQRVGGGGGSFTKSPLTTTVGKTLEYEIVLKNTGNASLKFSGFGDANCDAGTLTGGPGGAEVAPGGSTTYTCTRLLSSTGTFANTATVTGTPPGEGSLPPVTSNKVEAIAGEPTAKQKVVPLCESSQPVLRGVGAPETGTFTAWVASKGVSKITFYLDGRKLKTFKAAQAKGGKFKVKLDARKLPYGVHRLSFQSSMANINCATTASARTFVRPRPISFTG